MFVEYLRKGENLKSIDDCFRAYSVSRLPTDIGLTHEEFATAVVAAPSTRPERYTILEHLDLSYGQALKEIDDFVTAFG